MWYYNWKLILTFKNVNSTYITVNDIIFCCTVSIDHSPCKYFNIIFTKRNINN